jgi:Uma2 family endonuclease
MATQLITPPQPRLLTVEEWVQLPNADEYELIDGVLRLRRGHPNYHEFAVPRLGQVLISYLDHASVGGSVFGSNTKYRIRGRRGIMPDLSVVLGAKVAAIDPEAAYNRIGPDLAVEVLSPDQDEDYVEERLSDYWTLGAAEVWIVDPKAETVTGDTREAHEFVAFAKAQHDEAFASRLLAGLSFSVRPLWMRRP